MWIGLKRVGLVHQLMWERCLIPTCPACSLSSSDLVLWFLLERPQITELLASPSHSTDVGAGSTSVRARPHSSGWPGQLELWETPPALHLLPPVPVDVPGGPETVL